MYIGAGLMKNDLAGGIENAAKAATGIREKEADRALQDKYQTLRMAEVQAQRDLTRSTSAQAAQARLEGLVESALKNEMDNPNSDLVSLKATATKGNPAAIDALRVREAELRAQFARDIGARSGASNAVIQRYITTLPSAPPSGSLTSRKYSITEVK